MAGVLRRVKSREEKDQPMKSVTPTRACSVTYSTRVLLHAFPTDSAVTTGGKRRATVVQGLWTGKCGECENLAAQKWFTGR
jgi:uncharacterized membrane protein